MAAMAQAYMQPANKGTLIPGQTIAVNKYTVQVERYLSQGGFAHVYLVRTATPVMNTSHHVLKRIAVPNEAMLTEVKKEVDIMRILKGHLNIVYLIDAAWHRLPNGTYEVFILMEYCAGGGIIDMMNRRLRERLTEPEILTIFCDVCEGLAAMHSLKPPLLHRDLKVENILQASATLYKLCDFGSATPVQKVPTNAQEIRMLEADLNRHTTLQYRAPEMVDVYLRRPVDEKSDVWALGVLLYKLCYYTTPFEEHGPLAILNVQYKVPPYPIYSQQMNALIASMLREHGAQRPTVFELLDHVHRLRGTKSRFTYNIPPRAPPLSPTRTVAPPLQALSPNVTSLAQSQPSPMDSLVTFKSQPLSTSPAKNAGVEAREKVLEAIAPMRRGRPIPVSTTPVGPLAPASPKGRTLEMDAKFGVDDDHHWSGVRGHKSGQAALSADSNYAKRNNMEAWEVGRKGTQEPAKDSQKGFGDDFSTGFGRSFGDSFQPARSPVPSPKPQAPPSPRPQPVPSTGLNRRTSVRKAKDAFEGLGLATQPPPQTLGEARKSRTGLASLGMPASSATMASSLDAPPHLGTSNTTYRPPSSHAFVPSPSPRPDPQSTAPSQAQSWRPLASRADSLTAEKRFPSLEELDREFASPLPGSAADRLAMAHAPTQPPSTEKLASRPPSRAGYMGNLRSPNVDVTTTGAGASTSAPNGLSFTGAKRNKYEGLGARSQNVTGTAMRDSRFGISRMPSVSLRPPQVPAQPSRSRERERSRSPQKQREEDEEKPQDVVAVLRSRPSAARRRRTAGSKTPSRNNSANLVEPVMSGAEPTPPLPPRPLPQPSPRAEPRDWLTGADEDEPRGSEPQPVMRESPSKRASFIERSPIQLAKALEAEEVLATYELPERAADPVKHMARKPTSDGQPRWEQKGSLKDRSREERHRSPHRAKASASRVATGAGTSASATATGSANTRVLQLPLVDTRATPRSGVTPSPNGLTENWSPIVPSAEPVPLTAKSSSSSSSEEGPENVSGYSTRKVKEERMKTSGETTEKRKQARSKGRQSSVHDLVGLWSGGTGEKDKEPAARSMTGTTTSSNSRIADAAKRRSVIIPASSARPPPPATKPQRSTSPQPLVDISIPTRASNVAPPPSSHKRQPSAAPASSSRLEAMPMATTSSIPPPMSGRTRPQSMFITSPSKASMQALQPGPSSSPTPSIPSTAGNVLSPPIDPRPRRSRRSSISDMVQHYEAINTSSAKPPAPLSPTKPTPLHVRATRSSGGAGDGGESPASPSAAASRFPRLSPTSSPVTRKANLAVPDDAGQGRAERESGRRSPGLSGLPGRVSPLGRPSFEGNGVVSGLPGRRSPMLREAQEPSFPVRKATVPAPAPVSLAAEEQEPVRSPSPERPYQGVSRLIDRWQKAVDDSGEDGGRRGFPVKRAGVAR